MDKGEAGFQFIRGVRSEKRGNRSSTRHLAQITIRQGLDDGKAHTIYVDEITVGDEASNSAILPPPPTGLHAKGYDRHVELTWTLSHDLRYYKIYRSPDGEKYVPIGIQKGSATRYEDFLGASEKTAFYKISAVDENYNESAFSAEAKAVTRAMNDDELLTVVQEGYFRYYWDGAHPIAGMAIEILPGDENLVAVGASGHGIMALLVGVERDRPSCRNASSLAARRISRVEVNSNLGDVPLIV